MKVSTDSQRLTPRILR